MVSTWSETALLDIAAQGGGEVEFRTITETVDIDIGDKDFDVIATLKGGRLVKFNPQEPTTITLEAYPLEAGTDSGTEGKGFFDLMHTADASQPVKVPVDRTRTPYRMCVMWTDAGTISATGQVIAPTNSALRVIAADGYFTSVKPSFTDGVLKFTVAFKVPPFNKAGTALVQVESIGGSATATLTAVASYTSTVTGI
jgi:hypothetical protein